MKYTINELANSKGVSQPVREALLQMEAELDATNRQVEILSDALAESRREVATLKANIALDKKAENARELGLDYEPAPVQEPVAQAWDEGYRVGIDDERTSEANIGIAGFDAKVEPARNNPYRTTPPAAQRQWIGLTDEEIEKLRESFATRYAIEAIEAKLRSKNDPM
jgi:hypothetical protein